MSNTTIILPTYNERENLPLMLDSLFQLNISLSVIVVDDNSPDGTGILAQERARMHPEIHVIVRTNEKGLGTAYIKGFRAALENHFEYIVTMDCDFSHSPHDIPRLLSALKDADLVIGSRYISGGKTTNWPWHRRLLSVSANSFTRCLMGLTTRDCTSGFRVFRSGLLSSLLNSPTYSTGYSLHVELLWKAVRKLGACVREVPIEFVERKKGKSKISIKEVINGIKALIKVKYLCL